ncbi:hypothetical protein WJX72_002878 [[Myrmecia] bisecta]|uniref:Autophagy protein ATG5 UblA domain-containing protein n=1 Tax=[Myrmecia] bisecta TaxID=41462 RepID=A0AAW1QEG7_9CHLO
MHSDQARLRSEHWAGRILLRVTLSSKEITATGGAPDPLYVLAPRIGYLPTVASQAFAHFQHLLPPGEDTPWFDFQGLPLKWQLPIGVLHDLVAQDPERPWSVTVHFRSYPGDTLLPWEGQHASRAMFFNSLKEAAYICKGHTGAMTSYTAVEYSSRPVEALSDAELDRATEVSLPMADAT